MINIAVFGMCLRLSSHLFVDILIGKTECASCNQFVVQTVKPERIEKVGRMMQKKNARH